MLKKLIVVAIFMTQLTPAHAAPNYVFPIADCEVTYAHVHHNYPATDILTPAGCKFVSPVAGTIDEVNRIDRWNGKTDLGADRGGLYVSVIGVDGVRYYGSHLKAIDPLIQPGVVVTAGQLLGKVGTSGDARGTKSHLHFGISWTTPADTWWVRRGEVYPWKYLDAWKIGKDLSPAKSVAALKVKVGEVPPIPKY